MESKSREQRLNDAIRHLISVGLINGKSTTKSIAQTMGRNSTNISSALRGDVRYLNPKFVRDFCATYKNIISENWLLDGTGEMLTESPNETMTNIIPEESLMNLSREELISLVKQLMALHSEQTAMYQMLIRQNDQMIRNGQERFNNITNIIFKNV